MALCGGIVDNITVGINGYDNIIDTYRPIVSFSDFIKNFIFTPLNNILVYLNQDYVLFG